MYALFTCLGASKDEKACECSEARRSSPCKLPKRPMPHSWLCCSGGAPGSIGAGRPKCHIDGGTILRIG